MQRTRLLELSHLAVLATSVLLIFYISASTFSGIAFTDNPVYMRFQFFACIVFILDFFIEIWLIEKHRWKHFFRHISFLIIAIPYLNIIAAFNLHIPESVMEYIKYMPLIRGAYIMILFIREVSTSRIMGLFMSYLSIIVLMLYFSSLLFYTREHTVNAEISNYLTAVWWCALEFTTIGAPINPVTPTGKVLAAILSAMGVIMFPLFTVYLTDCLRKYFARMRAKS